METIQFWKNWSKPEKLFLYFSGLVLFTAMLVYTYRFYLGEDITNWEVLTESSLIEQEAYSFDWNGEKHVVNTNDFVSKSYFQAAEITFKLIYSKLYFGFIVFSLILALVGFSYIKKSNAFVLAMAALGGLLFFFSFDVLEVFGRQDHVVFSSVFLVLTLSNFFLNNYKSNKLGLWFRFLVNFLLVVSIFTLVIKFSLCNEPVLYMTNFASKSISVIVLLFSLMVGYDVLSSFFYLISSSKSINSTNTLVNFLLVCLLYIGSLLIFFLEEVRYISWGLTILNPFVLLLGSTVLGIWGHYKRRDLYQNLIDFRRGAIWLYFAGAIITISSISYAFQTSNTGMISSFKQMIVYGHLTMGVAFILYVLKNFWKDILDQKAIWPDLYKPKFLTHRYVRFIGVSTVVLLVVINKYVPLKKWKSGSYTYKADAYSRSGQKLLAKENYNLAYALSPTNYKAQFSSAMNALRDEDIDKSLKVFDMMLRLGGANVSTFLNMANIYAMKKEYFNSVFILKKGLVSFPSDGFLLNNLGFYQEKEEEYNSVYSLYSQAFQFLPSSFKSVALANNLAFGTKFSGGGTVLDSLIKYDLYDQNLMVRANKQAAANKNNLSWDSDFKMASDISPVNISYIVNSINSGKVGDFDEIFQYAKDTLGGLENIAHAMSISVGKKGDYYAFDTLSEHVVQNSGNYTLGYYYFEQGKTCLSLGLEENAYDKFSKSIKSQPLKPQNEAPLYMAKLELMRGDYQEANRLLDKMLAFGLSKKECVSLKKALSVRSLDQFNKLEVDDKIVVLRYGPFFQEQEALTSVALDTKYSDLSLFVLERAIRDKNLTLVQRILTEKGSSVFNDNPTTVKQYLSLLARNRLSQVYLKFFKKHESLVDQDNFYKAVFLQYSGLYTEAELLYKELWESNSHHTVYGELYLSLYKDDLKDYNKAYSLVNDLILVNDYWLPYKKTYIALALKRGDFVFARETMKEIVDRGMISSDDYESFYKDYQRLEAEALEDFENDW